MGVSKNSGTPKSSILIGFSIINHPFWGVSLFLEIPVSHFHQYDVFVVLKMFFFLRLPCHSVPKNRLCSRPASSLDRSAGGLKWEFCALCAFSAL